MKHLLHRVVKEVRVHDRTTVEALYAVPNLDAVRTLGTLGSSGRTRTYNPPVNSRVLCH